MDGGAGEWRGSSMTWRLTTWPSRLHGSSTGRQRRVANAGSLASSLSSSFPCGCCIVVEVIVDAA